VGQLLDQYDDNLGVEDYDYWMRMNSAFLIAHLGTDETLYRYRVHEDSLSGRAVELRIHERADRLMDHQRRRAEFYDRPWTIYVDGPMWNRLGENIPVPHRLIRWLGEAVRPKDGEKTMFLVEAGSLPKIVNPPHGATWTVATWFDGDAHAPHVLRGDIRRTGAVCFAKDDITLHRLALTTAKVFAAESTETMLAMAIREANDRTFRESNRSPKEHERKPPRIFRNEGRRLNVLLQVDTFTQGGMEQVVIDLAESLDPKYFSPSLLLLGEGGDAVAQAREKNLRVLLLPETEMEDGYRKLLDEEKIDLINAHYSLYGANIAAEKSIPFIQTIHNTYVWITPELRAKYLSNDQFTTAYTCVSNMVAYYSDVKLGLPPEKMLICPNGIDASRFEECPAPREREETRAAMGFGPNDFVFLNVGTIQPTKAQIELVHAFERVIERHSDAKLMILGRSVDPKHLAELEWHIDRLHLNRDVVLGGHREDVESYYWAADALVLPSLWEGWSLAMIEAACAGLPIVATNVGGALEMFDDVAGNLIAPPFESITDLEESTIWDYLKKNDPTFIGDLAKAMISICADRPRTLRTESIRRKFDRKNTYRKYEELYLWLIQGGHPSALHRWRLMAGERSEPLAAARTRRAA
jgi:glycosyltransferase involved in cell wall biosynthesis